jgi:hypothetical protein
MVFEGLQFACGKVKLINHLVSLTEHLWIDDLIYVFQELLTLLLVVECLHLLYVNQVVILVFAEARSFTSASQFFFTVLNQLLCKNAQAVIEVFHLKCFRNSKLTENTIPGPLVNVSTSVHRFLSLVKNYCKQPTFATTSKWGTRSTFRYIVLANC